ncbi:recombinase [Candidatus Omnitrophus magneticus]|uniref:Recombinase n=1 Tax=Candidatus Omnitrophus magneticus TaxID=1609969 RepID=A0A0F0CQ78_9BACT|nr:recombinase [Candidatus Omnitrophus magneticus]
MAPKLKIIWEMAAENKSLCKIAQELDRMGLKSPQGKDWRKQSLGAIIKNPFYKGYLNYADEIHKGNHEAIVDEKLWEKANRVLMAKLPGHCFRKAPKEYYYLLSGLLRCGKCGSHLISVSSKGQTGKRFFYYICGRSKQGIGCDQKASSATMFDSALIAYFRKASRDQEIIVKGIGNAIIDSQMKLDKIEAGIVDVDTQLETTRAEAKKLLALAMTGTISQGTTFKAKLTELDEEIFKLEDKLARLQAQKSVTQMSAHSGRFLHQNLRFAMQYLDQAPPEAQRSLLQALIKEIIVFEDRIELRMYLGEPDETMPCEVSPENGKSLTESDEALTTQRLVSSGCQKWLPKQDTSRTTQPQYCQLLMRLYKRRRRRLEISIDEPFPEQRPPSIYIPKNVAKEAVRIRDYLINNPDTNQSHIAEEFGVTRARISQLIKINTNLPDNFITNQTG